MSLKARVAETGGSNGGAGSGSAEVGRPRPAVTAESQATTRAGEELPDARPSGAAQWEMTIPKMGRLAHKRTADGSRQPPAIPPRAEPAQPAVAPVRPSEPEVEIKSPAFLTTQVSPPAWRGITGAIAFLASAAVCLSGALYFYSSESSANSVKEALEAGPPLPVGASGWITDFSRTYDGPKGPRVVSVMRASLALTDFRMEFEGLIDKKALGWVIRANDPDNYYVMKLETVKPGANPIVALVRFAVVGGVEQSRTQIPLPITCWLDTVYKVRVQARGNQFTTWIQGRKIDEWTDNQIASGGVGSYAEGAERFQLKGEMKVFPLLRKLSQGIGKNDGFNHAVPLEFPRSGPRA